MTTIDVDAILFPHEDIAKLGVAPLSSMFLFGESRGRHFDDFQPEVHNSDGLLINNARGEWLWRPLANHQSLQLSAFLDEDPVGFGLFQRDLEFRNYQDLQAEFHRRPSIWVRPLAPGAPVMGN